MRRLLDGHAAPSDTVPDAELLASEILTNAIVHSASGQGGTLSVAVVDVGDAVRVEVVDDGAPTTPHVCGDPYAERGRGLRLVEAVAARWGVCRDAAGTTTWFELESTGRTHADR